MFKRGLGLAALALLAAGTSAHAGVYLSGNALMATYDYSDVDNSTGYMLGAGYRFNDNWAVELRYFDTGEADIQDDGTLAGVVPGYTVSDVQYALSGFSLTGAYVLPVGQKGSNLFVRAGLYQADAELSMRVTEIGSGLTGRGSADDDGTQIAWGLGFDWMLTPAFGLRGALDGLYKPKDFANEETITLFSLGLLWNFADSTK